MLEQYKSKTALWKKLSHVALIKIFLTWKLAIGDTKDLIKFSANCINYLFDSKQNKTKMKNISSKPEIVLFILVSLDFYAVTINNLGFKTMKIL